MNRQAERWRKVNSFGFRRVKVSRGFARVELEESGHAYQKGAIVFIRISEGLKREEKIQLPRYEEKGERKKFATHSSCCSSLWVLVCISSYLRSLDVL